MRAFAVVAAWVCVVAAARGDVFGPSWINESPANGPAARSGHAMSYTPGTDEILLFGGTVAGVERADTWLYGPSSGWSQLFPGSAPGPRSGHRMVYLPTRGTQMLYGGFDGVWGNGVWEFAGGAWTLFIQPGPGGRSSHGMVYDSARHRVVVFGGVGPGGLLGDTWEFDVFALQWINRTPALSPSPRQGHGMAYDFSRRRVVLFGGLTDGPIASDTWEWDGDAGTWTQVNAPGPSARYDVSMGYDAARRRVTLFGGSQGGGETWEFNGVAWTRQTHAASPPARLGGAMVYDARRSHFVLFGGRQGLTYLGDTWRLNVAPWGLTYFMAPGIAARGSHAMAHDPGGGGVLIFGGSGAGLGGAQYGDTWRYDGTTFAQVATTGPSARVFAAMAGEDAAGRVLLFGGLSGITAKGDTWAWSAGAWEELFPATSPGARYGCAMAYDAARQRVVLFGGADGGGGYLAETWEWDGAEWSDVTPVGDLPAPRYGATLTFDPSTGKCVLQGGSDGAQFFDDTWEWDGAAWSQAATQDAPGSRWGHVAAWSAARRSLWMFGGLSSTMSLTPDPTWLERDNGTWWYTLLQQPDARFSGAAALDPARETVVLFGGRLGSLGVLKDLWQSIQEPPAVRALPVGVSVAPGGSAAFGVDATGTGPLVYEWRKNGVTLSDGDTISGSATATLTIDPVGASDAAVYDVVVTNAYGEALTAGAALVVAAACPTDLDGDGQTGSSDLAALLGSWGAEGGFGAADFDQDGFVGSGDLAALLGSWGPCAGLGG